MESTLPNGAQMIVSVSCADRTCIHDGGSRSEPFQWNFSPNILQIRTAVVVDDGDMFYFSIYSTNDTV